MYCKLIPTLVLSSLLIPALSLAIPQREELERRDLAAGSVEILESREPFKTVQYASRNGARSMNGFKQNGRRITDAARRVQSVLSKTGQRNSFSIITDSIRAGVRRAQAIQRLRNTGQRMQRIGEFLRNRQPWRALKQRDLADIEDLSARGFEDDLFDLEAREPGSEFDELDARSFIDLDDDLVSRSLFDEIDDLDARSLFDDFEDFEAREFMGEASLDELD